MKLLDASTAQVLAQVSMAAGALGLEPRALAQPLAWLAPWLGGAGGQGGVRVRDGLNWLGLRGAARRDDAEFARALGVLADQAGQGPTWRWLDGLAGAQLVTVEMGQGPRGGTLTLEVSTSAGLRELEAGLVARLGAVGTQLIAVAEPVQAPPCALVAQGRTGVRLGLRAHFGAGLGSRIEDVLVAQSVHPAQRAYFRDTFAYLLGEWPAVVVWLSADDAGVAPEVGVEFAGVGVEDMVRVLSTFWGRRVGGPLGRLCGAVGAGTGALELVFERADMPRATITLDIGSTSSVTPPEPSPTGHGS